MTHIQTQYPPLVLTRFLYSKDEVELSLLTALLKKAPLTHIYYWAYELYYSGFPIFDFLRKIYLDFYYESQPAFMAYLNKKYALWQEDKHMKHVAYVLCNLYNLQAITGTVFLVRQYVLNDVNDEDDQPIIIYKFKKSSKGSTKMYQAFFRAWKSKHMASLWFYFKRLLKTYPVTDVIAIIGQYLALDMSSIRLEQAQAQAQEQEQEQARLHYFIARLVNTLYQPVETDVNKRFIYNTPKQEQLDHICQLEEEQIPLSKHGLPQVYKTLQYKRMLAIEDCEGIGAFKLARWAWATHAELVTEHYFHWEFYAMGSPVWLKRLEHCGGKMNQTQKTIEFSTEQDEAAFYELYAYELDEQPLEVQAMSMAPIKKINGDVWYKYIFAAEGELGADMPCADILCADIPCADILCAEVWNWEY